MKHILVYGMSDNPGGIETYLLGMSRRMKKYGLQFDFISDFPGVAYDRELKEEGSSIYFIPAKGKKLFSHWKEFAKVLKKHPEYDTVYFNILDAGAAFSMLIPWVMRRKIVVHSHNGSTDKMMLHKLCRPFLKIMADQRLACSKLAAVYMFGSEGKGKKKALIIPNAIDAGRYDYNEAVRNEYREKLDVQARFVVCHIGRISEQKNPYRLLDIFSALCKKEENAVLLYAGNGELKEQVMDYARKLPCADKIRFLGVRSDIPEILQASDVFLLPSLYEGLPIVAVEAQAAGLPAVLSTAVTKETDITGNVRFLDLRRSNENWADELLRCRKVKRERCRDKIIDAGYDLSHPVNDEAAAQCFM